MRQTEPILGEDDYSVGDEICYPPKLAGHYGFGPEHKWVVEAVNPDEHYPLLCRHWHNSTQHNNHTSKYRHAQFNGMVKIVTERPYDPTQMGDREDDI
jgi:hypothetical protein